jgi:hypothetical protein
MASSLSMSAVLKALKCTPGHYLLPIIWLNDGFGGDAKKISKYKSQERLPG